MIRPAAGVGQEDPARLQPALADHVGRVDVEHADLAGQHDQAVVGHPVPARAQPVAVQHGADHRAVGERDAGRAVPRLHQRGVEPVEGPPRRVHLVVVLPRLGDHHQHRVRQRPAAQVQQFQALVEAGRVAAGLVQDRQQPLDAAAVGATAGTGRWPACASRARIQFRLPRIVLISPLCAMNRYGWASGQDGNVLVENRECDQGQRRGVPRIGQVRVERLELGRGQHPLVDDGPGGQAGEVAVGLVLDPLAQAERPAVQVDAALRRARRRTAGARCGSTAREPRPQCSGSCGTSRQPRTVRPSSAASRCTSATASSLRAAAAPGPSAGRNAIPAA